MLKTGQEVKKLVLAAWEPQISPIELVRKIVPRSFNTFHSDSNIHKGLIVWSYKRGAATYINCIYLNWRVDFMMSMLTGEVFKVDMAIRGSVEDWEYYKVKDDIK
jgi:hypothetical protein